MTGWRKPLPRSSNQLAELFWASKPDDLPRAPIEFVDDDGVFVCRDPAPTKSRDARPRPGPRVEHVIGHYTLRACGIHHPHPCWSRNHCKVDYPDQGERVLTEFDPARQARLKEQRRAKRDRSRIVRDGDAPRLDPALFRPEHRWAVDRVNWIASKRFSPPETDARGLTTWATDPIPIVRHADLHIFGRIAKGGGNGKIGPKACAMWLVKQAKQYPALRDAPTPTSEGRVSDVAALYERPRTFPVRELEKPTFKNDARDEPSQNAQTANHALRA
jgi:hypothetical protein